MGFLLLLFCLILYSVAPFTRLCKAIYNLFYKVLQNRCIIRLNTRRYRRDYAIHAFLFREKKYIYFRVERERKKRCNSGGDLDKIQELGSGYPS